MRPSGGELEPYLNQQYHTGGTLYQDYFSATTFGMFVDDCIQNTAEFTAADVCSMHS